MVRIFAALLSGDGRENDIQSILIAPQPSIWR